MLNMGDHELDFEVPPLRGRRDLKVIDTALPSPLDIAEPGEGTADSSLGNKEPGGRCSVDRHSVVGLIST
jgi:glycogen operon protein